MYKDYKQPFYRRLYSGRKIREKLGEISNDSYKIKLPKTIEKIIGDFYVVSQIDKFRIDENTIGHFVLAVLKEAERVARYQAYEKLV